jgi:lysophospholipase L1-like esterase
MQRMIWLALVACSPKPGSLAPDATPPSIDAPADAALPLTMADCYKRMFPNYTTPELDYDQFAPVINSTCAGTNQQTITGVQRVVFLGDSVTTGSPPTPDADFYRSRLADDLVQRFGLQAPDALWKSVNWSTGQTVVQASGDFASCAKWGARADDLMRDHTQVLDCLPESERDKHTLVIMTIGGNDIAKIAQAGGDGATLATTWQMAHDSVDLVSQAIAWMREPGRFPNGIDIVFNTVHEYTDATGDTSSCLVGAQAYKPWPNPQDLRDMFLWLNEQYVALAVQSHTDVVFMLENFCGHGFHNTDPASPCYRGPNTARWLDDTCVHPNPTGHGELAKLYESVIAE